MTVEQVYARIVSILEQAAVMNEETFDKTKAFKFVNGQLLNLRDDMSELDEKSELLDDGWEDRMFDDDEEESIENTEEDLDNRLTVDDLM